MTPIVTILRSEYGLTGLACIVQSVLLIRLQRSASTCHEYSGPMRGNMCLVITCNVSSLTVYMELTEVTSQLQGFAIGARTFNVDF